MTASARVGVYALCMCVRVGVHGCGVRVGELQAAWHIRTDQLFRVTCRTGLLLYSS